MFTLNGVSCLQVHTHTKARNHDDDDNVVDVGGNSRANICVKD
jgi:hypothetical protein